jgi:hypothetical protein
VGADAVRKRYRPVRPAFLRREVAVDVRGRQLRQPSRLHRLRKPRRARHTPALRVLPRALFLDQRQELCSEGVDALPGGCRGLRHGLASCS